MTDSDGRKDIPEDVPKDIPENISCNSRRRSSLKLCIHLAVIVIVVNRGEVSRMPLFAGYALSALL